MNFKDVLSSNNYNFLKDLNKSNKIILLTVGGSHAYGTNLNDYIDINTNEIVKYESDLDIRGIAMPNISQLLGLSEFDHYEDKKTDTVIHSFKKAVNLLLSCNPNIIEMLATEDEQVLKIAEEGKFLKDNLNLFLSQKVFYSFNGYAFTQKKLIENALSKNPNDFYNNSSNLKTKISLLKKAMHMIRLKITCLDILEKKKVIIYREKEKEFLLDIRKGKYTFKEIFEISKDYDNKLDYALKTTSLPIKPNFAKIENLVININKSFIKLYENDKN